MAVSQCKAQLRHGHFLIDTLIIMNRLNALFLNGLLIELDKTDHKSVAGILDLKINISTQ